MRRELVGLNAPLFLVHLAVSYTCTAIALVLLMRDWWRTGQALSGVLVAGALLPWGANILNEIAKASPAVAVWLPVNPTLPGFGFSALFIGYAVMRFGLLDPRPVARDLLFESLPELVVVLDDAGVIVDANQAAIDTLAGPDRPLTGRQWADAVGDAEGWSGVPMGGAARVEKPWRAESGTLWFDIERRPLVDRRQRSLGALIVLRDITARKRLEDDLRRESYSDRLTGLSNRRYFEDECARLRVSREFPVTVVAFDLDGLKIVNDSLGHEAGDRLLQSMAVFLRQFFRAGDRIFRVGGDEFSVLLPSTDATEAEAICTRLGIGLKTFNAKRAMPLQFSAGWAVIERGEMWEGGIRQADERLYSDKRRRAAS
jgi:diguanylate cyclase (GGDEF)-like protein